jgi:hypothetical protein
MATEKEIKQIGDFLAANDFLEWSDSPEDWNVPAERCNKGRRHGPDEDDTLQNKQLINELIERCRNL